MQTQPPDQAQESSAYQIAWNLDWNLLRTYMVIVQEQGITAAARRLNLKQPTVSNALKRLESCLGAALIERGPRCFEVTARGQALFRECGAIFGSVNRLSSALEEASDQICGTVQLAMASHVTSSLLDETLESFHRLHPAACISIDISSSRDVIQSVLERKAAAGICLVREEIPELNYRLLYTEHFGFFCGPRHQLFGRQGLQLEDLQHEHCVSFNTDQLDDALRPVAILRAQAGFDENTSGTSSSLEEVRRMVIVNMGIGALPIHVVRRDVADGLLFRLPPYEDPPAIDIWLVCNPSASLNQAELEFIRLLTLKIKATPLAQRVYGRGKGAKRP